MNDYTLDRLKRKEGNIKELVERTIYLEKIRAKENPWRVDPTDEYAYWNQLGQQLAKSTATENGEEEAVKICNRIINRYSEEILGGFKPKTFRFARKLLTGVFKRLFNTIRFPFLIRGWGTKEELWSKLNTTGSVEQVRKLFKKGTVVLVPTHFSNLDSILLGYFIDYKVGIPAFSWGAGLNLFDYELFAHYMNKLGTYRVDRRKKNPIYLESLKSLATLSLHVGLNNIFFPGGTRSRSGAIENKLKLGLLQSTMEAQRLNIIRNKGQKIFVVPVIMGYHFVLEANSLIEQHLKSEGKEKYTQIKKKTSKYKKTLVILQNLMKGDTDVSMHFCNPMDVLGNKVDEEGNSMNRNGKLLDLKDYFSLGEEQNIDYQRERVYTQILTERILAAYKKENVVLSSHLVAFVMFNLFKKRFPKVSIYELVNKKMDDTTIPKEEVIEALQNVIEYMTAEGFTMTDTVQKSAEHCLYQGLRKIGLFHVKKPIIQTKEGDFGTQNLKLLYYYHNRLTTFGLEGNLEKKLEAEAPALSV